MIEATFKQKDNDHIISFEMTGHADFAEVGSDIVCAAASSLSINAVNSIEQLAGYQPIVEVEDGYLYVEPLSELSDKQLDVTHILLTSLLIGLKDIEEEYRDYIQVKTI
ncbi:ribosomal-processing cysteine protease Prp [Vagococcus sp. DIV0080]|uniref:Ribosomal processing cysteine protease Prp n=1 Tax=Candidatus Vagococcus giribetii TaxID=2230876 RepID=A0ABS3HQB4_9ENTE|nr:ribosomal-processing cysteine protease Prp [Vagococcus sp. DIV0080]MBO0475934.1 ribosomal-processing cysteine protease Prp [Vagococcus sp. DIV0080]